MKGKRYFIRCIQIWGVILLTGIGASAIAVDVAGHFLEFALRTEQLRADYISQQKETVRHAVQRTVVMITRELSQSDAHTREIMRERTQEAHTLATRVYQRNCDKDPHEIGRDIVDVLRHVRYAGGAGHYIAGRLADGLCLLQPDCPELEGKRLEQIADPVGQGILRDLIDLAGQDSPDVYTRERAESRDAQHDIETICCVERFDPLGWYIGAGLSADKICEYATATVLEHVSRIRFGTEGYLFINRLNGDALVSNGRVFSGSRKLWEEFDENPDAMQAIFRQELQAARTPGGAFITYTHRKLSDPARHGEKISYVIGIPGMQWLAGAGFYCDDVETAIAAMQTELRHQITNRVLAMAIITVAIVGLFLLLFGRLSNRLKRDTDLFISWFTRATVSDEPIDRTKLTFTEFDNLAEQANRMQLDRQQAREELRTNAQFLQGIFTSIQDGISILSPDLTIRHVNDTMNRWYADRLPLEGKTCFACYQGRERPSDSCPTLRCLESGRTESTIVAGPPGSTIEWLELFSYPMRDPDTGAITGVVEFVRDITLRRRTEEKLRRSEADLRLVLDTAIHVAFIRTDVNDCDARITNFSPGAEKIFGWQREGIIGQPVAKLHIPEDVARFPQISKAMWMGQDGFSGELTLVRRSGERFPALLHTHPVFDRSGAMVATIGVIIDISQQKRADEARRIEERLRSLGTLAGGIAHDFNNILLGMYGSLDNARESIPPDHPACGMLGEAEKSMDRATRLTGRLLTFASGGDPVKEDVRLGALVQEVVPADLADSAVNPAFDIAADLWPVTGDAGQLRQVITSLTVNALQAMPDGGRLFVSLVNTQVDHPGDETGLSPGRYVTATFLDQGAGIAPEHLDRIFEPYFSTRSDGNGLGLATVYSILTRHGGAIHVDSRPGHGAAFTFHLPAAAASPPPAPFTTAAREEDALPRGTRVLVMDDEAAILRVVTRTLKKAGCETETVIDGQLALERYRQAMESDTAFDIVIMDLTIPNGMGGREAVQHLLQIDPDARVIVASGYSNDPVMANYRAYGFQGLLAKPFRMHDLRKEISRVLHTRTSAHPDSE